MANNQMLLFRNTIDDKYYILEKNLSKEDADDKIFDFAERVTEYYKKKGKIKAGGHWLDSEETQFMGGIVRRFLILPNDFNRNTIRVSGQDYEIDFTEFDDIDVIEFLYSIAIQFT